MEEQTQLLRERPVSVVTVEQPIPDEPVTRQRESVKVQKCIAYLKAHPEALTIPSRTLEAAVKDGTKRLATHTTWTTAKKLL